MQPEILKLPPYLQGRIEQLGFWSMLFGSLFGYLNTNAATTLLLRGFHGNIFDLGKLLMVPIAVGCLYQIVSGHGLYTRQSRAVWPAFCSYAVLFLCSAVGLLLNILFQANVTYWPVAPLGWSILASLMLRSCVLGEIRDSTE